jgi:N-formylglutamate amidohydrolase
LVCLGTDDYHTPEWLLDRALDLFRGFFDSVAVNRPYSGSIVPEDYLRDDRVLSIMVEINRALYMDETTGAKLPCFDGTRIKVRKAITRLVESFAKHPI